ncbi:MAG: tetratricopeptide repeat protein [Oleiphilaceae bacterium]|nr:tetratricopeptide repeat protein [Oleiphilaceae bacterium]
MDEFKTEEEQIAAIKNWWKNNGSSVLLAVVAALAIVFGYRAWQNNVEHDKATASALYQQLVSISTQQAGLGDDQSASFIANELKEKFTDSEYARFAALFLAKQAVTAKDYDTALAELDFVLESNEDPRTIHIVNARKARILSAKGEYEAAHALLDASDEAFAPAYLEIKGDIYILQGDRESAKESYLAAFDMVKDAPQRAPLLGVKLSDLGVDTQSL